VSEEEPNKVQTFVDDNKQDVEIQKQKEEKKVVKEPLTEIQAKIQNDFATETSTIVFDNQKYLSTLDEFDVGIPDKKFKRAVLSDKVILGLKVKQKELAAIDTKDDIEDYKLWSAKVKEMGKLVLQDITDEELDQCDLPFLKEIIDNQQLATQGFRPAKRM